MWCKLLSYFKKPRQLPDYVQHGGELSFPAPIVLENAALNCFVINIGAAQVSSLLKQTFSIPSNGSVSYIPVTNHALVVLGNMPKIYSSTIDIGWATEQEMTIWVLAAAVDSSTLPAKVDHLALFPAYVVANDPYSLVSGREALGFFKSWGKLSGVQEADGSPECFSVDVFGHKIKGDQAEYHHLLSFDKRTEAIDKSSEISSPKAIGEFLLRLMKESENVFHSDFDLSWALFEKLFLDMWEREFPIALLKQIRDSSSTGAAYQAILESNAKINHFKSFRSLGDYQFSLNSIFSFKVEEQLGIVSDDEPLHGFRVELDFQINGGKEIWKA